MTMLLKQVGPARGLQPLLQTGLILLYTYFQIPLGCCCSTRPSTPCAKTGASPLRCWAPTTGSSGGIGLPVLTPALLGTFVILLANALGAYATVYALTTGNFNVLPIRIAGLVAGDISLDPNLASALAMVLVGLMTLVTVVHQWLLKRSYHAR
jgi:putative spermidine/putrescine transport system permease protein